MAEEHGPAFSEPMTTGISQSFVAPSASSSSERQQIDLARLKDDPFLLFPQEIAPTRYDTIVEACRKARFEPIIGQLVPHMASIVNLVAAELGISIVPASMMQVRVTGIVYRKIAGQAPTTRLALAFRRGETSPVVAISSPAPFPDEICQPQAPDAMALSLRAR
jgi:DNA-binding transcriptional LysR family regulator